MVVVRGHLRSLPPAPAAFCLPWHAGGVFEREPVHGAACCFCDLAIAAPESARRKHVACIYCGLERGLLEPIEIEPNR